MFDKDSLGPPIPSTIQIMAEGHPSDTHILPIMAL